MARRPLRVALAHDWLTGMRGGEAVLERICLRYPGAPIYTLFHDPGEVSTTIEAHPILPSLLNTLPAARRNYRRLLPLFPLAARGLDVRAYDLVVSTSHCVIKALRVASTAAHVCYVHTPMRYIYDQYEDYFGAGRASPAVRLAMRALRPALRRWDRATANRPTHLVANSRHVRDRIRRCWGRDATVVHPPVDLGRFRPEAEQTARDYYLMVGAFAPYKRVDLAIQAFNALNLELRIVGGGPQSSSLQRMAGPSVRMLGRVDNQRVSELYAGARALVFPGEEDFGITPLEAQASGTPVIALGRGGALETVRGLDQGRPTGIFFRDQRVADLVAAVQRFEQMRDRFRTADLVENAARFGVAEFDAQLAMVLDPVEAALIRVCG